MEGIARINVEDPQKAPKILTKSHRKWDRNNQRKNMQKNIKRGPTIHSKSTQKSLKNQYLF